MAAGHRPMILGAWVVLGPLAGVEDLPFEGGGPADKGLASLGYEFVVKELVEPVIDLPEVLLGGEPVVAKETEIEWTGEGEQGL